MGLHAGLFATLTMAGFAFGQAQTEPSPLSLDWRLESTLFAAGLIGDAVGQKRLVDMPPATASDLHRSDLAPWDRFAAGWNNPVAAHASDVTVALVGGAMVYVDGWSAMRSRSSWNPAFEDATLLLEGLAWSSALSLNIRALAMHPRPLAYGSDASASDREAPEAAGSFFSGHASAAFLGATYLATVYPMRHPEFQHPAWLWGGSLAAATLVAGLRVAAGKHFPSDVVVGAGVGTMLGWILPEIHRQKSNGAQVRLQPLEDGVAVQATWSFFGQSQAGARMARSAVSTSMGREK